MSRATKPSSGKPTEAGAETIGRLADGVERVEDELRDLRAVLDDIRDELQSSIGKSRSGSPPEIVHVTRMAADPLAPDWAEKLNCEHPHPRPPEDTTTIPAPGRHKQGELWEASP